MSLYQERNSIGREKLREHPGTGTTLKNGEGYLAFADSHRGPHRLIYLNSWFPVGGTV